MEVLNTITTNGMSIPWSNTNNNTEFQLYHELRYATRKKRFDCYTLHPSRNIKREIKNKQKTIPPHLPLNDIDYNTKSIEQYTYIKGKEDDYYSMTTNRNNTTTAANTNDMIDIKHSSFRPHKIMKLPHNQRPPSKITKTVKPIKESYQVITHTEQNTNNKPMIVRKIDDDMNKLLQNNSETYTVTEPNTNITKCKGRNKHNSLYLPLSYTTTNQYDLNTYNTSNQLRQSNTNHSIKSNEINAFVQYIQTVNKHPEKLLEVVKEQSMTSIPSKGKGQLNKKKYVDNKYLDELLRRVTRRVDYISQKNNVISEDDVMNLLSEESKKINTNVDKLMMATCFIKNFSLAFKDGNELLLLPMINSIKPYENNLAVTEVNQKNNHINIHNTNEDEYMKSIENVLMKGFKLSSSLMPINEKKDEGLKLSESLASLYNRDSPQQAKTSKSRIAYNQSPIKTKKIKVYMIKSKTHKNYSCVRIKKNNKPILRRSKSMEYTMRRKIKNIDFVLLTENTKKSWFSRLIERSGSGEMKNNIQALYSNKFSPKIIKQKSAFYHDQDKEKEKENSSSERYKDTDKKDKPITSKFKKDNTIMNEKHKESHIEQMENKSKDNKQPNTKEKIAIDCLKEKETLTITNDNNKTSNSIKKTFERKKTLHELIHESKYDKEPESIKNPYQKKKTIEDNDNKEIADTEAFKNNEEDNKQYQKKNIEKDKIINKSKDNKTIKNKGSSTVKKKEKSSSKNKDNESITEEDNDKNDHKTTYKIKSKQSNTKGKTFLKPTLTKNKKKGNKTKIKGIQANKGNNDPNANIISSENNQLNDKDIIQRDNQQERQILILEDPNEENKIVITRNETKRQSKYKRPSIIPPYYQPRNSQPLVHIQGELNFNNNNEESNPTQSNPSNTNPGEAEELDLNSEGQQTERSNLFNSNPTPHFSIVDFKDNLHSVGLSTTTDFQRISKVQIDLLLQTNNIQSQIKAFRSEMKKNPFRYIRKQHTLTDADIIKLMFEKAAQLPHYDRASITHKTIMQHLTAIEQEQLRNKSHHIKNISSYDKKSLPSEMLKRDYSTLMNLDPNEYSIPMNIRGMNEMAGRFVSQKTLLEYTKKSRMNEFNMQQELRYHMETSEGENGKEKFKDFLAEIEHMKNMDGAGYLHSLEEHYDNIKENIEGIVQARETEERINKFLGEFSKSRALLKYKHKKEAGQIKVIDHKFDVFMGNIDENDLRDDSWDEHVLIDNGTE